MNSKRFLHDKNIFHENKTVSNLKCKVMSLSFKFEFHTFEIYCCLNVICAKLSKYFKKIYLPIDMLFVM